VNKNPTGNPIGYKIQSESWSEILPEIRSDRISDGESDSRFRSEMNSARKFLSYSIVILSEFWAGKRLKELEHIPFFSCKASCFIKQKYERVQENNKIKKKKT